ncbi:MAG: Atxe2 family lasso peptide isopeptidase [Dyella sp.]|uniref:Atxe2 family lasso peptide isopeptidase n=1 Tax=Dyella sp. TaxID=1869338 RepID=UPI003F7D82B3
MSRFDRLAARAAGRDRACRGRLGDIGESHWLRVLTLTLAVLVTVPVSAQVISPRRLLEVTDLGNPVISPDGAYVAFRTEKASIARNTYDTAWYVQRLDATAPPLRIADGGAPLREYVSGLVLPSPAEWSPDGRWLYYRARLNGRVAVWRAAADGSGAQEVTSDAADVRDFVLGDRGLTLTYSVGATRSEVLAAEEQGYNQGVHIDESVVLAAGLFRSSKIDGRAATQQFLGDWFSTGPLLAKVPDRWKVVDLQTGIAKDLPKADRPPQPLTAADLPADLPAARKIAQAPHDARIAVLLPGKHKAKGQLLSLYVELAVLSDRHSSHPVFCTAEPCHEKHIGDIQWRPGSDEVLFTVTDYDKGRAQSIYGWNVQTGAVRPIVMAEGLFSGSQRYWDIPCAVSIASLVCVAAAADHPPRLEAVDLRSARRRILFEPNRRLDLDMAATAPAELIRWKDEQGREFTGQLFQARGASARHPPPLFVTFYTCDGFLRGGLGDEWPLATLAEQGISALCINAIPEFRIDFVARHDQGRAAVESVVKRLAGEGRIDGTRVGMGGLSYGSEVTLWTLAHSDVVTAASVSSISPTPTYYLLNSLRPAFRSNLRKLWQLGAPAETPAQWRKISPMYHLDRLRAPILFQMPEQEYRMALDYALPLIRRHKADAYVFPDEAHIKFQPRHKLAVYERNVDWFRFWLQGYEDPAPAKADQYRVWREIKRADSTPQADARAADGS